MGEAAPLCGETSGFWTPLQSEYFLLCFYLRITARRRQGIDVADGNTNCKVAVSASTAAAAAAAAAASSCTNSSGRHAQKRGTCITLTKSKITRRSQPRCRSMFLRPMSKSITHVRCPA